MKRRELLICAAALTLSPFVSPMSALAKPLKGVTLLGIQELPGYTLGNCSSITKEITNLESRLKWVRANKQAAGEELYTRYKKHISTIKKQLKTAKTAANKADFLSSLQYYELAFAITVVSLGCIFTGPIAVGSLAALSLISGTAVIGIRATKEPSAGGVIVAYTKDRTFTLGGVAAQQAAKTVLSRLINIVYIGSTIRDTFVNAQNVADLDVKINELGMELDELHNSLSQINNANEWGTLHEQLLQSTVNSLKEFVEEKRDTNCLFPGGTHSGPNITLG